MVLETESKGKAGVGWTVKDIQKDTGNKSSEFSI